MLDDRVAIVTGSRGTGCGRASAVRLANEGAAILVTDINEPGGQETVRLIESQGGRAAFFAADVREGDQMGGLGNFAEQTFGGLTLLVNNASGPFRPNEVDYWADTVQTELVGAMHTTRYAIDAMRRSGAGAIVNIASISAL